MPLITYSQTRPWAQAIAQAIRLRKMPPWFADPTVGHFANDPSLTPSQIAIISDWAEHDAPAGDPGAAPPLRNFISKWQIPPPDAVFAMQEPVSIPERGDIEYTEEIVPTGFTEDKWVRAAELLPSSPAHVHHAVVYIRPPDSKWLRNAPVGRPFTASDLSDPQLRRDSHWTDSDMLLVYAPGSSPDQLPDGMAKFIPAGSDLVFQMHYTANGSSASDRTSVGVIFAKQPPKQRVLTLQLTNDHFSIPPGAKDYRVEVHGTMPNDAMLLSFLPHLHLRGKRFEYNIVHADGAIEPLLRVNYDFHWQLSYKLAVPRFLKAGTILQAVAWYDNSSGNSHNPNPEATVTWGDQTWQEMMVGFFDVAVPAGVDKWRFFVRQK